MDFEDKLDNAINAQGSRILNENEDHNDPDFLPPDPEISDEEFRFNQWKKKVNAHLIRMCGMGADDLPDYDYWVAFHAGDSPKEAAEQAIEHAKTF